MLFRRKVPGTFYGMYPTTVLDFDGNVRPSPISIVQDQQKSNAHFLDMQIMQLSSGICDVKMHGKRDSMPALASYRKFPHIETTVSTSCKYAVFHESSLSICISLYQERLFY